MKSMGAVTPRPCRCCSCADAKKDAREGFSGPPFVDGTVCGNCGFYVPLCADQSEGHCRRFGVRKHRQGLSLIHRRRGELAEGDAPLVVGGAFSCGEFRALHDRPAAGNPLLAYWADADDRSKGEAGMKRLRATPIEMELVLPEEGDNAYPEGHWVRASTNLIFPAKLLYPDENLDDEVYCALLSPGEQVGGKAGGDKEAAFQAEAHVLARMLIHLGIIITEQDD